MEGFQPGLWGKFEFWGTNSLLHRLFQKHVQFRGLKRLLARRGLDLTAKRVLDGGCGSGYETELIVREFAPAELVAFDVSPQQIALARKRNEELGMGVDFFEGDLVQIQSPDATFDAVVIINVLHHIPQWGEALREVARVLKPDGILLVNEIRHGWPSWAEFAEGLEAAGFALLESRKYLLGFLQSFLCQKV